MPTRVLITGGAGYLGSILCGVILDEAYHVLVVDKRNYIHILDVADCFTHCIKNADSMQGRPYNAGLDDANLSKEELALKIKEHVPDVSIHVGDRGQDPDKRNYIVSNERLAQTGSRARRSLDRGIEELLKGYRMLGRRPLRNY